MNKQRIILSTFLAVSLVASTQPMDKGAIRSDDKSTFKKIKDSKTFWAIAGAILGGGVVSTIQFRRLIFLLLPAPWQRCKVCIDCANREKKFEEMVRSTEKYNILQQEIVDKNGAFEGWQGVKFNDFNSDKCKEYIKYEVMVKISDSETKTFVYYTDKTMEKEDIIQDNDVQDSDVQTTIYQKKNGIITQLK